MAVVTNILQDKVMLGVVCPLIVGTVSDHVVLIKNNIES